MCMHEISFSYKGISTKNEATVIRKWPILTNVKQYEEDK